MKQYTANCKSEGEGLGFVIIKEQKDPHLKASEHYLALFLANKSYIKMCLYVHV